MEYRLTGIGDIEDIVYLIKAVIVQLESNGIEKMVTR